MPHPMVRIAVSRLGPTGNYLRILASTSKSRPLAGLGKELTCSLKSDSSKSTSQAPPPKKILSLSMLLLQDGLDIQELPLVVRRADNTMFPFTNNMSTGKAVRPATKEDKTFKDLLQQCSSVKEVFKLLEIPSDKVTGYSASYAMQRMCQLKESNTDWDDLDSFICTAVMNELFDTVRKEVSSLSNDTIQSLVRCVLNSENFSMQCAETIKEEIEKRIGESLFSIQDLCGLSDILQGIPAHEELYNIIWIHIRSRYKDIDETNVASVCRCVQHSHKSVMKMVDKQMRNFWWKLNERDVTSVLNAFVRLHTFHGSALRHIGQWVDVNVHDVKETHLMKIISAYIHFNFSDPSLIRALERYIPAKGLKMDTTLLALVLEYCRGRRYLSTRIMDAAAMHFCVKGDYYSPLQLYSILRPFGHLNYLPKKPGVFLMKVENVLTQQFSEFETLHILELLCCFAYVEKTPVNFAERVLNPSFYAKLTKMDKNAALTAGQYLQMFQCALRLESKGVFIPALFRQKRNPLHWPDNITYVHQMRLQEAVDNLLGVGMAEKMVTALWTVYVIDLMICVNNKSFVPVTRNNQNTCDERLALLCLGPEHYCINTQQLLGAIAMKKRHLSKAGYTVIEIPYFDIAKQQTPGKWKKYLMTKLAPYIDFVSES